LVPLALLALAVDGQNHEVVAANLTKEPFADLVLLHRVSAFRAFEVLE
jgi:hypothetical protein